MQNDIDELQATIKNLQAQQEQAAQTYYQVEGALRLAQTQLAAKLNAKASLEAKAKKISSPADVTPPPTE